MLAFCHAGVLEGAGDDSAWVPPDPVLRHDPSSDTGPIDCAMTNAGDDKKWKARFAWTDELKRLNKDIFGNNSFRPNQQQAINATLAGKDVFLLMPTGGGKLSFRSQVWNDSKLSIPKIAFKDKLNPQHDLKRHARLMMVVKDGNQEDATQPKEVVADVEGGSLARLFAAADHE